MEFLLVLCDDELLCGDLIACDPPDSVVWHHIVYKFTVHNDHSDLVFC